MPNPQVQMAIEVAVARCGGVETWVAMSARDQVDAIFAEFSLIEEMRREIQADQRNRAADRHNQLAWAG